MQTFTQHEIVLRPMGELTGWLGHLLHGAVFARMDQCCPALGTRLHTQMRKPFSLQYTLRGGLVALSIHIWDDALRAAVPEAFAPGGRVLLSRTASQIVSATEQRREDFARPAPPLPEVLHLRFLTPTCFRSSGRTLLFPEWRLLCESLCRDYAAAGGIEPSAEQLAALCAGLCPVQHQLHTETVTSGTYTLTGFRGACSYAIDRMLPPETRAFLAELLRVLPFTGVGYKTAQGMGGVQTEEPNSAKINQ
jgi:CRISPR-associated endoribonuclease Cas6